LDNNPDQYAKKTSRPLKQLIKAGGRGLADFQNDTQENVIHSKFG